ncbi:hypothetical protein ACOL21_04030 [Aliarcobacter butzleri]
MSEIETIINNNKILKVAEDYYNKMEKAYKVAIEMPWKDGIHFFYEKERENKELISKICPVWLISSLEAKNFYYKKIILDPKNKNKGK